MWLCGGTAKSEDPSELNGVEGGVVTLLSSLVRVTLSSSTVVFVAPMCKNILPSFLFRREDISCFKFL